ncbi:MAG TPA: response regulator [Solirubrobacteraceae bacterium]|nr:response regulator [Solirubrobacteraceae bacterium]
MISILLVEDSAPDAMLIRQALHEAGFEGDVEVVVDGVQALERLARGRPPDLMLLDLNLPRKDGRAVLAEMSADEELREIPVIVLTTSSAPQDVTFAYRHCANSYVRKPLGLDRLVETARAIREFWLEVATLPRGAGA